MKRVTLCTVISLIIIGISTVSLYYMKSSCLALTDTIVDMETSLRDGDKEKALRLCGDFSRQWEEKEHWLELLIRHQHLDEVAVSSRNLPSFIEYDTPALFFAETEKIKFSLKDIWEKEILSLPNIL